MKKIILTILIAALCAFLVWLSWYVYGEREGDIAEVTQGEGLGEAHIGGPFTLTDHHGNLRRHTDFYGKYLLVYFGYTYCPDICPTGLSNLSEALKKLGERVNKIQPLFITVDPKRDNIEELERFIKQFHPSFIALTGSEDQLKEVMKAYKVYAKEYKTGSDNYLIDHTSIIYFMSPKGQFITHFTHQTSPEYIADVLRHHIRSF